MPTSAAELIDFAVNDNAVDLKTGLDDILRDKVLHKISVAKPDVIQGMFGTHGIVPTEDSPESEDENTTEVLDSEDSDSDETELSLPADVEPTSEE